MEFLKLIRNGARHDFEIDRNARDKNMAAVATANSAFGRGSGCGSGGLWTRCNQVRKFAQHLTVPMFHLHLKK
jgi:hypothetical protein